MSQSSSTGAQYVAQQKKSDAEKLKYADFTQENAVFGPTFFHTTMRQVKGTVKPDTCC
jgi:hypothetical protein